MYVYTWPYFSCLFLKINMAYHSFTHCSICCLFHLTIYHRDHFVAEYIDISEYILHMHCIPLCGYTQSSTEGHLCYFSNSIFKGTVV